MQAAHRFSFVVQKLRTRIGFVRTVPEQLARRMIPVLHAPVARDLCAYRARGDDRVDEVGLLPHRAVDRGEEHLQLLLVVLLDADRVNEQLRCIMPASDGRRDEI